MSAASSSEARALAPTHPPTRTWTVYSSVAPSWGGIARRQRRMERRRRCELRSTRAWSVPNTKLAAFPIRLRRAEFPVRSAPRTRRFVGSHGSREEPKKRQLVIFVFVPFWPTCTLHLQLQPGRPGPVRAAPPRPPGGAAAGPGRRGPGGSCGTRARAPVFSCVSVQRSFTQYCIISTSIERTVTTAP